MGPIEFDLEVDEPKGGGGAPVRPGAGAAPGAQTSGSAEFGVDDIAALDVGLEDALPPKSVSAPKTGATGGAPPSSGPAGLTRPAQPERPVTSAEPDPYAIPTFEVEALAAYGDPPFEWLPAVPYALRVLRRRRELQTTLAKVRIDSEQGRRGVQGRMVAVLEAAHARHADNEAMAILIRPIQDILAQLASQTQALAQAGERYRADVAALDAELSARKSEKDQLFPEKRSAQVLVEDASATLTRAKEEFARLGRELGAAHQAASEAAGASEYAPPEHARRIAALEAQRGEASSGVTVAERALQERRGQLSAVEQRIVLAERAIADVHARRKATDTRAAAERSQGEQAIRAADHQRLDACEGALRHLVANYGDRLEADERARFAELDGEMKRFAREVRRYELAVGAHNAQAFQRGLMLLGAAAAVVLGLLAVALR